MSLDTRINPAGNKHQETHGLETIWIPSLDPASRSIMVVLHGLGDSVDGYLWLPSALSIPSLNYLLVNAPDPYYGGYSWYDLDGDAGVGVFRSRRLLTALLTKLDLAGYPNDQCWMFGFSQGCLMTLETGLRFSTRLAGLIGVSGYLYDPVNLAKELGPHAKSLRVLVTHGRQDPLIPISKVRTQMETLKTSGIRLEWEEFNKAHTIDGPQELELIRRFILNPKP